MNAEHADESANRPSGSFTGQKSMNSALGASLMLIVLHVGFSFVKVPLCVYVS